MYVFYFASLSRLFSLFLFFCITVFELLMWCRCRGCMNTYSRAMYIFICCEIEWCVFVRSADCCWKGKEKLRMWLISMVKICIFSYCVIKIDCVLSNFIAIFVNFFLCLALVLILFFFLPFSPLFRCGFLLRFFPLFLFACFRSVFLNLYTYNTSRCAYLLTLTINFFQFYVYKITFGHYSSHFLFCLRPLPIFPLRSPQPRDSANRRLLWLFLVCEIRLQIAQK